MSAEKRKGLGRGLGALMGEEVTAQEGESLLPISRIEPRQDQPRRNFDEAALAELAASIKQHGLLQPVVVRETEKGWYQLIAGERRWRAARIAGLIEIPARVIEADDRKAFELALVENLQREDLSPVEEAQGYKALMTGAGLTQEKVAERVGKSRPVVANALRLLTLPAPVLDYIEKGQLSISHARLLLELEGEALRLEAARHIIEAGLTVRQTETFIKKLGAPPKPEPEPRTGPDGVDYTAEAEKNLTRALGRRVHIKDGRKKGKIEIEFYGTEDLNNLYDALRSLCLSDGGAADEEAL